MSPATDRPPRHPAASFRHGEGRLSRRDVLKIGAGIAAGAALSGLRLPGVVWAEGAASLQDRKRIYLAPDDHTDYLWTADEETYRQSFLRMLDYYLDLADQTADLPADFQSRWNCDGSFWLWTYEQNRTPAQFDRLIARIRDGHISAPLNALVVCLGGAPAEAILRGMYYAGKLERRHNLRFPVAVAMENQTLPYGLGALWAGAGARYSWKGICDCATRVASASDREHDIYWYAGPDGSRILMKWNSMLRDNQSMGGYAEARDPAAVVDYVDSSSDFQARYPYRVIGAFGKGWDDLETLTDEFVTVAQDKSNSQRRVIVSNQLDFFADFLATYGAQLPTVAASFGNEWDLYCASMAEVSARIKRATELLRSAEALATLVTFFQPDFMAGRGAARDLAWMDLGLYWEHDWTGNGSVSNSVRAQWQRRLADEVALYVNTLQQDATRALGNLIQNGGAAPRFFVFNPLSWPRTEKADLPYDGPEPVQVFDLSSGAEVPAQIIVTAGGRFLRLLASDIPPVGYKVFEIRAGAGAGFGPAAALSGPASDGVIDSAHYRITVSPRGAIISLIDKGRAGREWVRVIDDRALNDLGPGDGTLTVENAGPVSLTLLATSDAPLQHTSRITVFRDSARIEIENEILQNFSDVYTWGFGFNLEQPDLWHEEVGAVIRAGLLADGGHYSPRNARYDWLTLNHFADIGEADGAGVTLSNADCYFMQYGRSTPSRLDTTTPLLSVLAGGQVDGAGLGMQDQDGDSTFLQRFALQPRDAYDPAGAMRFALEHQNPLVTGMISPGPTDAPEAGLYPETVFSLLSLSDPDVLLWALKPADDLPGVTARLWNLATAPAPVTLSMNRFPLDRAYGTTHIETPVRQIDLANGELSETLERSQLRTYLLVFDPSAALSIVPDDGVGPVEAD